MKFTEVEQKCEKLESSRKQLEAQLDNLSKLENEAKERNKEIQMLREIAKIRGEEFTEEGGLEELENARKAVEALQKEIEKIEQEIYQGLKDVAFPIPLEVPKPDPDGKCNIIFQEGPYNHTVRFLASTMNSDVPLELDKVQLYPDKVIITGVKDPPHVIERLKILRSNICRLAQIALQENDPDVEEVAEYLHGSDYRELWEIISGKKRISYDEMYTKLSISNPKEKKRVRNFFTNLEQLLKDKCPFLRVESGVYELTFFGSLVWKRYRDRYPTKSIVEKPQQETVTETPVEKEEKKKVSVLSLNKYLSKEDKEIIYGKEIS